MDTGKKRNRLFAYREYLDQFPVRRYDLSPAPRAGPAGPTRPRSPEDLEPLFDAQDKVRALSLSNTRTRIGREACRAREQGATSANRKATGHSSRSLSRQPTFGWTPNIWIGWWLTGHCPCSRRSGRIINNVNALEAAEALVRALARRFDVRYLEIVLRVVDGELVILRAGTPLKPGDLEQLEVPGDVLGEGAIAGQ